MAQSSLCGKLHVDMELKASADKVYEIWTRPHLTAKVSPNVVNKVDLLEGEWGKQGCVILWDYVSGGKPATSKEIIEVLDYKNKTAVYKVIGGTTLEGYKSFKATLDMTPKHEGCLTHWTVEYEKLNENIADPTPVLQAVIDVGKAIDAYLN